jgi:hypothetical protein
MFKLLSLCILILCGCSYSRVPLSNGSTAVNFRLFMQTEGFAFDNQIVGSNSATHIELKRSNPDAEALKAVAEGAAQGTVKGFKP